MLLELKETRVVGIPVSTKADGTEFVTLIPGVNELDDAHWDALKNHPMIKMKMSEGHIELLKGGSFEDIDKLTSEEAVVLVKKTVAKDKLQSVLGKEKRKDVVKALKAQIAELEKVEFRA